ncbi:acyltransferase [Jiulongibacter sediminis]|uniref:acyltransferase family protein n=1 Tax=Jiulongibacter sediminis TaxID=1605367 RepID=UPI0026EFC3AD|nr:acyltransferase [Jiulongibacter sediminis]
MSDKTGYIKSLDGLRFLAVTLVLADHWSGDQLGFPASYLGVCMFFVLSGFLITRILLKAKEKDAIAGKGHGFSIRQFYIRRTIRIFPLYYLTLAVLFILNIEPVRSKIGWLASYMSNNYIAFHESWLGSVDHLWSLAVEEQFYLFFPFVILFLPLKNLQKTMYFLIALAVVLRAYFFFSGQSWIRPYVLMPACLDAFAAGGLLAFWKYYQMTNWLKNFEKPLNLFLGVMQYAFCVLLIKKLGGGHNEVSVIFLRLSETILSLTLIGFLIAPPKRVLKSFFEWSPLVYIGKISYGIYIFHNFIYNEYHPIKWSPVVKILHRFEESGNAILNSVPFKIIFLYVIVLVLASLSWFLFEKPINKLKNRFGY